MYMLRFSRIRCCGVIVTCSRLLMASFGPPLNFSKSLSIVVRFTSCNVRSIDSTALHRQSRAFSRHAGFYRCYHLFTVVDVVNVFENWAQVAVIPFRKTVISGELWGEQKKTTCRSRWSCIRNVNCRLNVQVLYIQGVVFNEPPTRLDGVAHQDGKEAVCFDRILDLYLKERPLVGIHRCLPKLIGVHLAQPFVTLDREVLFCHAKHTVQELFTRADIF